MIRERPPSGGESKGTLVCGFYLPVYMRKMPADQARARRNPLSSWLIAGVEPTPRRTAAFA
jgi:hypothetical protein